MELYNIFESGPLWQAHLGRRKKLKSWFFILCLFVFVLMLLLLLTCCLLFFMLFDRMSSLVCGLIQFPRLPIDSVPSSMIVPCAVMAVNTPRLAEY